MVRGLEAVDVGLDTKRFLEAFASHSPPDVTGNELDHKTLANLDIFLKCVERAARFRSVRRPYPAACVIDAGRAGVHVVFFNLRVDRPHFEPRWALIGNALCPPSCANRRNDVLATGPY